MQRSLLFFRIGANERAEELARKAKEGSPGQVVPLAHWVYTLERLGRSEEADEAMRELLELSAYIDDLESPVFERVAPVAARLELGEDWRAERIVKDDVGDRPPLDDLGPFRWYPYEAPAWELPDGDGTMHSSSKLAGEAYVLIFYLGFGCLHCVEQINEFAPKYDEFRREGLEVVAVSTETEALVRKSLESFGKDGEFPILLLSDDELEVFKRFRAFDDFEDQPLHGTFLIDAKGRVLWQDISYEPFMDPDFVIDEARRLLGKPAAERVEL